MQETIWPDMFAIPFPNPEKLERQAGNALDFIKYIQEYINKNANEPVIGQGFSPLQIKGFSSFNFHPQLTSLQQEELVGAARQFIYDAVFARPINGVTTPQSLERVAQSLYFRYGLGESDNRMTNKEVSVHISRHDRERGKLSIGTSQEIITRGLFYLHWFLHDGTEKNRLAGRQSWKNIQKLVGIDKEGNRRI